MGIENFPAALQPIIQQGMLDAGFQQALRSQLAYRAIAEKVSFPNGIGETVTKTRAGLKPTRTTPLSPSSNTNLDNGITPSSYGVEQFTLSINMYGDTTDLNTVTQQVGIASQFVQNGIVNGEQAARTLDQLARNALFSPYMGGNTRVRTTLGGAGVAVSVDDIRGFQFALQFPAGMSAAQALAAGSPSPTMQPVSTSNTIAVSVGSNVYTLTGAAADATNVSAALLAGGISGVLTFSTSVTVADGTVNNTVTASTAGFIARPNARTNTQALLTTDLLTMDAILDAVAQLRLNNVPSAGGLYNCYLDAKSGRQLFDDTMWRQLTQGVGTGDPSWGVGFPMPTIGVRWIPTNEAYVTPHPTIAAATVRRPIICGMGALVEGTFAGQTGAGVAPKDSLISVVDGVVMVTREPLDRFQQIIAQSWYWIGGYCVPSDITTNPTTMSTASNATYKRAIIIEHIG